MKRRILAWVKVAMLAPVAATYATGGCGAKVLRETADVLDEAAQDIDGEDGEVDLGDWLSDELEDL